VLLTAGGPACDARIRALLADPLDWARVTALAGAENALAPVWERVSDGLPEVAGTELRRGAWVAEFRQGWLEERLDAALAVLRDEGVDVVLLKGAAMARGVHRSFSARPMRDADLLVRPDDAWRAQRLLLEAGWAPADPASAPAEADARYRDHHHLPTLVDGRGTGLGLELHTALFPPGHPFRVDAADVWARAQRLDRGVQVPSPEDLVIHLAIHFVWSHQARSGAWRCFRDLAALAAEGGVHWGALVELARDARAGSCCYWALRLARAAAAVPVPAAVLEELRPRARAGALALLERHFLAGLLPEGRACPSVRLARAAWVAAVQPQRAGHGRVRPWGFDDAPTPAGSVLGRTVRRLREPAAWRRYGRALLGGPGEQEVPDDSPAPRTARAAVPLPALYPRTGTQPRGLPPGLRRARLGSGPTVSVVVASRSAGPALGGYLAALGSQCHAAGAELVVALSAAAAEVDSLRAAHPAARIVVSPSARTPGELRAVGMAEAEGDIVALADDGAELPPDWVASLLHGPRA
jgi:hypothetical protein